MPLEKVVFAALDPRGRLVTLTRDRLRHIETEHPEMKGLAGCLLRAVREPDEILPGRAEREAWYYLADEGPSAWIKVVVTVDRRGTARIITAFPRRAKP